MTDTHRLRWSPHPSPTLTSLPSHITRTQIPTPPRPLELLIASPSPSPSQKPILLFQHGGFGSAGVWIPFLTYFSQLHGHTCYAHSLRGHGASYAVGYWRLVWGTPVGTFVGDLAAVYGFVVERERGLRAGFGGQDVVLVGHSAGGGLVQRFVSEGRRVGGLVIVAGFPNFGGLGVYKNWFKLDPWFVPRFYIRDLWHSRSPLSSTRLVHQAFFSPEFPVSEVKEFERYMPEYESMMWPLSMMLPFVNVQNVLGNIVGWEGNQQRALVVAGERDQLMGVALMREMAVQYRRGFLSLVRKLVFGKDVDVEGEDGRGGRRRALRGWRAWRRV